MLAYVLALAVGLGSIALYMVAFFFPEIHRKNDFIWSGVGFFYALVLWIFARRISGGLLLGHVASVALLGWFGWQTLSLRRQLTPQAQQTPVLSTQEIQSKIQQQVAKLQQWWSNRFSGVQDQVRHTGNQKAPATSGSTETHPANTEKPAVEIIDRRSFVPEQTTAKEKPESAQQITPPSPPPTELVEAAKVEEPHSPSLAEQAQEDIEEIAPDAELAPPAEAPPDKMPPDASNPSA